MSSPCTLHQPDADRFASFPALARLRLEADDLIELAHQGFVSPELHRGRTRYKLRFRSGGRQIVRVVGGLQAAALVEEELARLQSTRRRVRELMALDRIARRELRDSKSRLTPLIESYGFKFHGRAIRRPRRSA